MSQSALPNILVIHSSTTSSVAQDANFKSSDINSRFVVYGIVAFLLTYSRALLIIPYFCQFFNYKVFSNFFDSNQKLIRSKQRKGKTIELFIKICYNRLSDKTELAGESMINKISRMKLPPIYKRNGKECYLDPIRKKLIYITPEETVRQRVVAYLMQVLDVPADMLIVESHLAHYRLDSKRRADIVIHAVNEDGMLYPIAIVECKAPGVGLDENVGNQLCDYCDSLGADYAMMVNDCECFCFHYEKKKKQYVQIDQFPNYKDMLDGKFEIRDLGDLPERVAYDKIPKFMTETAEEVSTDISPKTPRNLAYAAFNLWEGLLDTRHKMSIKQYGLFTLIEDYGVRQLSYGNAGGGHFYGLYRSFLINYKDSTEFISIGFGAYGRTENPETCKTALLVAIDNEKESHHALQLSIDDNLIQNGDTYIFYHHGRIAVGNKGSGKVSELMAFVAERYPKIIDGKKFKLGSLEYTKDWNLDDSDVEQLIENIITYALIRDEYRTVVKKNKS